MTGGDTFDGGVLEIVEGQNTGCVCTTPRTRPRKLLEPRLPAAPMKWPCLTPEPELLEWLESLGAAVPRGEHQA